MDNEHADNEHVYLVNHTDSEITYKWGGVVDEKHEKKKHWGTTKKDVGLEIISAEAYETKVEDMKKETLASAVKKPTEEAVSKNTEKKPIQGKKKG